jgi:hypothetical protein
MILVNVLTRSPINLKIFVDKTVAELKAWFEHLVTTGLPNHDFYPYLCRVRVASLELRLAPGLLLIDRRS